MKFITDSLLSGAKTQAYRSSCIQSWSAYTTLVFLDRGLYVEALLLLSLYRQTTPNPPLSKPPQVPRAITSLLLQHPQRPHIGQPKHWIMQIKVFFAAEDLRNHFAVCIKMGLESDSSISLTTRFKNLRSSDSILKTVEESVDPKKSLRNRVVRHDQLSGAKIASLSEVKVVTSSRDIPSILNHESYL